MLPTGVLVKTGLSSLVEALPGRLVRHGPSGLLAEVVTPGMDTDVGETLTLFLRSDNWCHIETRCTEELAGLVVESLILRDPFREVLSSRFAPDMGEYSYAYFRDGELMESFECSGPSLETVNFTSELRKVPVQSLLKASEFMMDSLKQLGLDPGSSPREEGGRASIRVCFPGKKTFWKALLGAVSSR